MKRFGIVAAVTALATLAFAACGGVSGTDDLFTVDSTGSFGGAGSGATTGPGPSTTSTTVTTSSSVATTSSSVASSSVASSTASSTSGGPALQVSCNNNACAPGQICCFNPNGNGDHCAAAGTCMPGYVQLNCNGPEDCPGGECCATVDVNQQIPYLGMACQASCNPGNQVVVCSTQQPDVCPSGTKCEPSSSLGTGYDICWPG